MLHSVEVPMLDAARLGALVGPERADHFAGAAARARAMLDGRPFVLGRPNAAARDHAIQRHATIVVQKSLAEGFGLTVVEPMWKHRPVVATRVGGIVDQIDHEINGLLIDDPHDLAAFGRALDRLLADREFAASLGEQAHRRARDEFLGDRHLERYAELLADLFA